MKKTILKKAIFPLIFAAFANPSYSELEYFWPDNIPKATQKTIEEKVEGRAMKKEYQFMR